MCSLVSPPSSCACDKFEQCGECFTEDELMLDEEDDGATMAELEQAWVNPLLFELQSAAGLPADELVGRLRSMLKKEQELRPDRETTAFPPSARQRVADEWR
jgi:hypothetical protein